MVLPGAVRQGIWFGGERTVCFFIHVLCVFSEPNKNRRVAFGPLTCIGGRIMIRLRCLLPISLRKKDFWLRSWAQIKYSVISSETDLICKVLQSLLFGSSVKSIGSGQWGCLLHHVFMYDSLELVLLFYYFWKETGRYACSMVSSNPYLPVVSLSDCHVDCLWWLNTVLTWWCGCFICDCSCLISEISRDWNILVGKQKRITCLRSLKWPWMKETNSLGCSPKVLIISLS